MKGTRGIRLAATALVLLLAAGATAWAQITTGSIAGSVQDSQGGVIPGATVIYVNEAQQTKSTPVVTNATGEFLFVNVPPGRTVMDNYNLIFEYPNDVRVNFSHHYFDPPGFTGIKERVFGAGGAVDAIPLVGTLAVDASSPVRCLPGSRDRRPAARRRAGRPGRRATGRPLGRSVARRRPGARTQSRRGRE